MPQEYKTLNVSMDSGVVTIELNRPNQLNAISMEMIEELHRAANDLPYHPDARVLVLKGSGRAFSAGYDVNDVPSSDVFRDRYITATKQAEAFAALEKAPVVRIAQLHGHVVGAGLLLAALCELRYATSDVSLFVPELDMGIPFSYGGVSRIARLIGLTRTADLVLNCRPMPSEDGQVAGFITQIVDEGEIEGFVKAVSESLAARPPILVIETLNSLAEAARDLAPADTVDLPHMFLAQSDPLAGQVLADYGKRFSRRKAGR